MPTSLRATILVVDDDPADREIFRRILQREGYAVVEARSGEEALRVLANSRVDLMILDLAMPLMDGPEVLKALKSVPAPKVIVATGSTYPVLLDLARQLGATTTLDKANALETLSPMARGLLRDGSE